MVKNLKASEEMSLKGFSIKKFLLDDVVKLITEHKKAVKIAVGAILSIAVLYPETAGIIAMLGGATYVSTRVLSFIDFYFSKVELE